MKLINLALTAAAILCSSTVYATSPTATESVATVYHIKEISPQSLIKIYKALGRNANGKVAVKISSGESMKSNHLSPKLIAPLVNSVNGTLVECNTAYPGNRNTTQAHIQAIKDHGYADIAPFDIMDADGDTTITIKGGFHLPYDIVGKNFLNYDFMIVLSHFKGHAMGGMGGALKNISIGIGSSNGKAWIHTAGKTNNPNELWDNLPEQDDFLESMADACKGVIDHMGAENMVYINVANNLSVDCDCNGNPTTPKMDDLGIYASTDPVALDRACVDAVFQSSDPGKGDLIERINSRHGTHTITSAKKLGLGSQSYKIIEIE